MAKSAPHYGYTHSGNGGPDTYREGGPYNNAHAGIGYQSAAGLSRLHLLTNATGEWCLVAFPATDQRFPTRVMARGTFTADGSIVLEELHRDDAENATYRTRVDGVEPVTKPDPATDPVVEGVKITDMRRVQNSRNGNPRFEVRGMVGNVPFRAPTAPDTSDCYAWSPVHLEGERVNLTLDKRGRIVKIVTV